ncbi:potassium channel family protein [Pseudophaeobacter flagellatus]|uniref:potassium channel family protein n=1 Tax=Pseudophaeobacter flagellatus TaxID=2899119 RepID=UPI001E387949|nr:potassium channel family protein [Pseudophaeobacter flagellatus]MCD9146874.1 potassium channel family protein [Pseudophaeobacter flagellatus]
MTQLRRLTIFVALLVVLASGTVFFHFAEGWSWLDSYFFTVITVSTVGYGNLVPVTAAGKLATTALIFGGLGVFALAMNEFAQMQLAKRQKHNEWLFARLGDGTKDDESPAANADDPPVTAQTHPPKK